MVKKAVIDLGSLKVKYLLAETEPEFKVLEKEHSLTLLGKGLKEGKHSITEKSLNDTIQAINKYKGNALEKKVELEDIKVVATESLRKASNTEDVLEEISRKTELEVEIITQEDEAKAYFKAVSSNFALDSDYFVLDNGGGSIQVLHGNKSGIKNTYYLPLGVYSLVQKFISNNKKTGKPKASEINDVMKYISNAISGSDIPTDMELPLIHGSTNVLDLYKYIKLPSRKSSLLTRHPIESTPEDLISWLDNIDGLTFEERERKYPFQYGYMWGIDIAFYNTYYLAKHIGTNTIVPSNINIAEGFLL